MRNLVEERMSIARCGYHSDLADGIRRVLRTRIPSNHHLAGDVAGLMTMHRRT